MAELRRADHRGVRGADAACQLIAPHARPGGTYLISAPLVIPAMYGNAQIVRGTLRASTTFPPDRWLVEIGSNCVPHLADGKRDIQVRGPGCHPRRKLKLELELKLEPLFCEFVCPGELRPVHQSQPDDVRCGARRCIHGHTIYFNSTFSQSTQCPRKRAGVWCVCVVCVCACVVCVCGVCGGGGVTVPSMANAGARRGGRGAREQDDGDNDWAVGLLHWLYHCR